MFKEDDKSDGDNNDISVYQNHLQTSKSVIRDSVWKQYGTYRLQACTLENI